MSHLNDLTNTDAIKDFHRTVQHARSLLAAVRGKEALFTLTSTGAVVRGTFTGEYKYDSTQPTPRVVIEDPVLVSGTGYYGSPWEPCLHAIEHVDIEVPAVSKRVATF